MRIVLWFFFSIALLASASVFAAPTDERQVMSDLKLRPACDAYLQSKCQKKTQTFDDALQFCEIRKKAHECERLAKEHPELQDLMLSCEPKKFCEQQTGAFLAEAKACLQGGWDGFSELWIAGGEAIATAWDEARRDLKQRTQFAKACDLSIACKRALAHELPVYNRMTDQELAGIASLTLLSETKQESLNRGAIAKPRHFGADPILKPSSKKSSIADGNSDLTLEQKNQLVDLWNMASLSVEKKYHQYGCYSPEAMAELKCYALGSFIDPTMVGGKVAKLSKADRILRAMLGDAKSLANSSFIRRNLYYSPTKPAQNREWMVAAAYTKPGEGMKFFDVENSVMKSMNDTLKDKNLVTSLTNYHKRILQTKTEALMKELKAGYPELEMLSYSDFKASRFAFKGRGPPDLDAKLAKILEETNQEFATAVKKGNLIPGMNNAEDWFRGGYGETADQATLASRFSRGQTDNSMQRYNSGALQTKLSEDLQKTESLRSDLSKELTNTSMMDSTLHADAFDILIKNSDSVEKTQSALKNRFGLKDISTATVEKMQSYRKSVDIFSPGIHIAEREVANLDAAAFGGLSADMAGMGSMNQRGTAMALVESKNLQAALEKTRQAERAVTAQFATQQRKFKEVMNDVVGPDRIKTICSGDDCVALPTQALSDTEKQRMLEKLSAAGYASKFRLSFIPNEVKNVEWRNQLSVHGESIEKLLRKNLSSKMEPEKLKGIIFGVDMKTEKLNEGRVKLMTATHPDVKLTTSEKKMIEENFKRALQQMQVGYYP